MKRLLLVVGMVVLGSGLVFFSLGLRAKGPGQPNRETAGGEAVRADSQEAPLSYPAQKITGNGVTIVVTPVQLAPGPEAATFAVTVNTHAVDLDYDLTELATLQLDEAAPLASIAWDGGQGGHHLSGTLTFPNVDIAGAKILKIIIREVADVPTWAFAWQLQ